METLIVSRVLRHGRGDSATKTTDKSTNAVEVNLVRPMYQSQNQITPQKPNTFGFALLALQLPGICRRRQAMTPKTGWPPCEMPCGRAV